MICILAGNYEEAKNWAYGQMLSQSEWFYPREPEELNRYSNFHVIVIGTAGQNVPAQYFENILRLAHQRGRMNRK
jgi:hypothetical protein